jgi:hypothetical protein
MTSTRLTALLPFGIRSRHQPSSPSTDAARGTPRTPTLARATLSIRLSLVPHSAHLRLHLTVQRSSTKPALHVRKQPHGRWPVTKNLSSCRSQRSRANRSTQDDSSPAAIGFNATRFIPHTARWKRVA